MLEHDNVKIMDKQLIQAVGVVHILDSYEKYVMLFDEMGLSIDGNVSEEYLCRLVDSVNVQRLSNHSIALAKADL